MAEDRDWVGTWFELAEERGESAEIPFGAISADESVTFAEWARAAWDAAAQK